MGLTETKKQQIKEKIEEKEEKKKEKKTYHHQRKVEVLADICLLLHHGHCHHFCCHVYA
jgi:hypothetical protein